MALSKIHRIQQWLTCAEDAGSSQVPEPAVEAQNSTPITNVPPDKPFTGWSTQEPKRRKLNRQKQKELSSHDKIRRWLEAGNQVQSKIEHHKNKATPPPSTRLVKSAPEEADGQLEGAVCVLAKEEKKPVSDIPFATFKSGQQYATGFPGLQITQSQQRGLSSAPKPEMLPQSLDYNVFYRFAQRSAMFEQRRCQKRSCQESPWFLQSFTHGTFDFMTSANRCAQEIRTLSRQWNLPEAEMEQRAMAVAETCNFEETRGSLKREYDATRMRTLRQNGLVVMEQLIHSRTSDTAPDIEQRLLVWKNNSCALDSMICILPHTLAEAQECHLFPVGASDTPSPAFTCPAASLVGALSFCNSDHQLEISDKVRVLCFDLCEWYGNAKIALKWSPNDEKQGFLCIIDVISSLFVQLLGDFRRRNEEVPRIETSIHALSPSYLNELDEKETIASSLLFQCDAKKGLKVFVFPNFSDLKRDADEVERLRGKAKNLLCTSWQSSMLDRGTPKQGKILAFIGYSDDDRNHFVSATCHISSQTAERRMYFYNGMRHEGTFQPISMEAAFHGIGRRRPLLLADSLLVVFICY